MTEPKRPTTLIFFIALFPRLILLSLLTIVSVPLWLLFGLGALVWGIPPNVPRSAQIRRYLRHVWQVNLPPPGLPFASRVWLTLSIVQKGLTTPILGLIWFLDELLYGRALDKISVVSPLFVISAGRSGSTQITRYLEEDPTLAAPNILQSMFPYLWLWNLVPRTIGKLITPDKAREKIQSTMPPELLERHETDPFKADTFDGSFYSFHLNGFALNLGPQVAVTDFSFSHIAPHDKELKEKVFVEFVDRIARKTLLKAGAVQDGSKKRFYIKGHFLYGAQALLEKYPDACFLTVIRDPLSRLQSGINYMRVNPADPVLGPVPWAWLTETLAQTEIEYCEVEQKWFPAESDENRCVIRFSEFVNDLEGAMKKVYRVCFKSSELPSHIPTDHPPRDRKNYSVNLSLAELGVDEEAIRERLASYIQWCVGKKT